MDSPSRIDGFSRTDGLSPADSSRMETDEPATLGHAFTYVVTDADTAASLGSGDVPVLGTPKVLALVEAATVAALAGTLPAERTSVGTRVELEHRAPSRVGDRVRVSARLESGDDRRVTFAVSVTEDTSSDGTGSGSNGSDSENSDSENSGSENTGSDPGSGRESRVLATGRIVRAVTDRSRFA